MYSLFSCNAFFDIYTNFRVTLALRLQREVID